MEEIRAWLGGWSPKSILSVVLSFGFVLIGVEAMVLLYYRDAPRERILDELLQAFIISTTVGLPVIIYLVAQHLRLQRLTEKLAYLSSTDQMTGLLNRQTFVERLGVLLHKGGRHRSSGVLAYIDADHFKGINDRYGHAVGDRVIQIIAAKISGATRKNDLCGRLGGEEFGIFLAGAKLDEAATIADRLRREINATEKELDVPGLTISVSIGIAAHKPGVNALETMQEADRSLYAAKNQGRNAIVIELERFRVA